MVYRDLPSTYSPTRLLVRAAVRRSGGVEARGHHRADPGPAGLVTSLQSPKRGRKVWNAEEKYGNLEAVPGKLPETPGKFPETSGKFP